MATATTMTRRRRISLRLALAALILLTGLEAALQLGHLYALRRAGRRALTDPGAPVIVCLGDSHTYGAGVAPAEAYPALLAELLHSQGYRVNVVNLGAPGTNTSEIRRRLPDLLDQFHPVAIVVLASVNNGWNRRDTAWSDRQDRLPVPLAERVSDFLVTRVRTVRAAVIILHRLDLAGPPEETARDRDGNTVIHFRPDRAEPPEATYDRSRRDLTAVIALARARHAVPILMTYVTDPEFPFEVPNRLLRETATAMNVPLADNDLALKPHFIQPDGQPDPAALARLFFPDLHPRGPAYALIAHNLARTLDQASVTAALPR
jgi:lysophospholipase L1-like esterase